MWFTLLATAQRVLYRVALASFLANVTVDSTEESV